MNKKIISFIVSAALLLSGSISAYAQDKTGWTTNNGETYYLLEDGTPVSGRFIENNALYEFDETGVLTSAEALVMIDDHVYICGQNGNNIPLQGKVTNKTGFDIYVNGVKQQPQKLKGKALKKGDCIGIAATSFYIIGNRLDSAINFLQEQGYKVKVAPSCTKSNGFFAGDDKSRAADLNALFADDEVDAILCMRGGYGSARILKYLDYEMIKQHPKLFIGFSDITALHTTLRQRCGLVTILGPNLSTFVKGTTDYTTNQFLNGIKSSKAIGKIKLPKGEKLEVLVPGMAEGTLIGGNLSVITSLTGTDYEMISDHSILFFEEVGEESYRIDKMLNQLLENGLFDKVDGIIIGDMSSNTAFRDVSYSDVIEEYAKKLGKPCIKGVPSGHGDYNMFLPLGVKVKIVGKKDGTAAIKIKESALE